MYAIVLGWPDEGLLRLGDVVAAAGSGQTQVELLGYDQTLEFVQNNQTLQISFPNMSRFLRKCGQHCMAGYTLRLKNVTPK